MCRRKRKREETIKSGKRSLFPILEEKAPGSPKSSKKILHAIPPSTQSWKIFTDVVSLRTKIPDKNRSNGNVNETEINIDVSFKKRVI